MAPVLPSSLSPHVCILPSPDLSELLESSGLPPLPNILQSFSPLPQVTTRTTSLVSVPHSSFALRFSDLTEVEDACREPEEQRAVRTLDWMAARIAKRCEKWIQDIEEQGKDERVKSPWWDELRRCAEGDFVPDRNEAWNHPAAVIFAVSTTSPNPLQTITALHSRQLQLPPWVDPTYLRYTLIVHPQNSPLSVEEANALFNAVKKQYGLHTYLLPLNLPSPPPPPIPVPALMPRLPPPPGPDSPYLSRQTNAAPPTPVTANAPAIPSNPYVLNTLRLEEKDIQATARFTREFVVMSLIPWMERCVVEWNEAYSSTRRLPSRLFSSTRRLFGSPSPSPGPGHAASSSVSSLPGRPASVSSANGIGGPLGQPRRLAEFATILGDYKLAIALWESMRKETKGGSDIIPILSSPSPALQLYASNAILSIHPSANDLPPHAQLRALLYAVRWEIAIGQADFLSDALEGERWLVWAAGNAEEAPSALLLAHAAFLSTTKKSAFRRAAFWYSSAANRLEKCGIKPLTVYFLQKAHELYQVRPTKELSPSFWDSEGKATASMEQFVDVKAGIEHPLARLLYTTGHIAEAVQMFLLALRVFEYPTLQQRQHLESHGEGSIPLSQDKTFLDDFRVAYAHLSSTDPEALSSLNLNLPIKLCRPKHCKLRFPHESGWSQSEIWQKRESQWNSFRKLKGRKEPPISGRKICVDETFWVDLAFHNPLDADIEISNLMLIVETSTSQDTAIGPIIQADVVEELTLKAKESQTVSIAVKVLQPTTVVISKVKYEFLSTLPVTESLASRGRRLNDTPAQRRSVSYSPDIFLKADISPADDKLSARFLDHDELVLKQGEICEMKFQLKNTGKRPIHEIWLVMGGEEELWVGSHDLPSQSTTRTEMIRSNNSLQSPEPQQVPLDTPLQPDSSTELSLCLHADRAGSHEMYLLLLFRGPNSSSFHGIHLTRAFDVHPLLDIALSTALSRSRDQSFILNVELTSLSSSASVSITQISTISPLWKFQAMNGTEASIAPAQVARFVLGGEPWVDGDGKDETLSFVVKQLEHVLAGNSATSSEPPEIDLICSHVAQTSSQRSILTAGLWDLIQAGKRRSASEVEKQQHPHIPESSHPSIFPLYDPTSVDVIIFWELPGEKRRGHLAVHSVKLGATHGALDEVIHKTENSKVKRSMYAETVREKAELVDGIRTSEWNADMDPTVAIIEGGEVSHDFRQGPCHVPVNIIIRNNSPFFETRVTLKLQPGSDRGTPLNALPAPYSGKLTFRCKLRPGDYAMVQPRLFVEHAGMYSVGPLVLETEIVTVEMETSRSRHPYIQEHASAPDICIVVRQLQA